MSAPRTPREAYAAELVTVARALRRAMDSHGCGSTMTAALVGMSERIPREWADPDADRHLPAAAVRVLPLEMRLDMIRALLPEGYDVVAMPSGGSAPHASLAHAIAAQREATEACTKAMEAAADGVITREEGAALLRECDEVIPLLMAIREAARGAVREGAVRVVTS